MQVKFSQNLSLDLKEYFSSNFPYGKILSVGEEYIDDIVASGCRTLTYSGAVPEDASAIFAYGKANADLAKSIANGKKLILATPEVYASFFDDIAVIGYKTMRTGYPDCVFIDEAENFGALQASAVARAVGLYAESLGILGAGLRRTGYNVAKEVLTSARNDLGADIDTEELILRTAENTRKLSAVSGEFFRLAEALYPEDEEAFPLHVTFFTYFTAVFAVIRFTKSDFCVILPEKDRVRTRILCDALKIKPPKVKFLPYDPPSCLAEARDFIADEGELKGWLRKFRLTAGAGTAVTEVLLDNLALAAELTGEINLYTILADKGYIDAITERAV